MKKEYIFMKVEVMANLQVKGMDDSLYEQLKDLAESSNRSVSQEVVYLLKWYLARQQQLAGTRSPAEVLLELSGAWKDERDAREIVDDLRASRTRSRRLSKGM